MELREGVGVRSEVEFRTSSAVGWRVGCTYLSRFGSADSPRSGRPSIFGVCECRLVVDGHPVPDGFAKEVLVGEGCSDPLTRTPGGFTGGGIISKLPRFERLSPLCEDERGMSKLTLRPETGEEVKAKILGDRPFWLIASGGNRAFPADLGFAESLARSFRPPSVKPRL